jgi:hypothetical protein
MSAASHTIHLIQKTAQGFDTGLSLTGTNNPVETLDWLE